MQGDEEVLTIKAVYDTLRLHGLISATRDVVIHR